MNENQFSAMLALIVPPIIEQITKNSNLDENKIIHLFYKSKLYNFEALHTMGDDYIIKDIDDYIDSIKED